MRPQRVALVAILLCNILPAVALPTARRALSADDYARAERALGPATGRLVSGIPGRPSWLADGRASYRVSRATGWQFVLVDPRRRTRGPAFDHARLAEAVSAALGRRVGSDSLPFVSFNLSADGHMLTFDETGSGDARGGSRAPQRLQCNLTTYRCGVPDDTL